MRVTIAQINPLVGAIDYNKGKIREAMERAEKDGADVMITPELSLTGYPPEDLLLREDFVDAQYAALSELAKESESCVSLVGFVERAEGARHVDSVERGVYNAVALLQNGRIIGIERKSKLPAYSVFDETRWFIPAEVSRQVFDIAGRRCAVMICEDLWEPACVVARTEAGADLVLSVNASPWFRGKEEDRVGVVRRSGLDVIYCNQVGGQDGIIYDGGSFIEQERRLSWQGQSFVEETTTLDLDDLDKHGGFNLALGRDEDEITWKALCLGLSDYVTKNGFGRVWFGISGGIDSALVAALAVDALGAENVTGVMMPSEYSSKGSVADARELADRLGIATELLPIKDANQAVLSVLAGDSGPFARRPEMDVAEENIQARLRGLYLMACSNKFGGIVLTTGNKSEVACGYSTLYGDAAGGLGCLSDVPKTLVYRLARWRNGVEIGGISAPIPENTITKPPSAELAPGQQDSDSLPDYAILDVILEMYVDMGMGADAVINKLGEAQYHHLVRDHLGGTQEALDACVRRVVQLVDRAEYKRRQLAPGLKISQRAFGRDRRLPITNGWA